jgi:transposase
LTKLGHEVRLMPPQYVKSNKHDAADAEGCCEAVQRPGMRVPSTIGDVLASSQALVQPTEIAVRMSGKYHEIVGAKF